ncbi:MAG: sulfotransferase [Desulfobacteraceae bacterium]|nr:MAG: sulfotransferase [Desulfobacteraceae bacterium]
MMENIIWLTGMPRSGTTWISQIFASHPDIRVKFCPLFSYSFKNALDESATQAQWQDLFSKVFVTKDEFMDQEHLRKKGLVPAFAKNPDPKTLLIKSNRFHHLTEGILKKCPDIKFISIVRHPCAVIHSWLSNPLEFPAGEDPKRQWRSGACRKTGSGEFWGFDDWKKVSLMHLRLASEWPARFFIQRYEKFLKDPLKTSQVLFDGLDLDLTQATRDFILTSQNRHDNRRRSVFRDPAKLPDWKTGLDQQIAAQIYTELKDTEFSVFLNE